MTGATRDAVVIGASAGGIEAMAEIARGLPADFPAAIFYTVHVDPSHVSLMPEILSRRGPLLATFAIHGERTMAGHIYVAPPDNHLLVREGYVHVVRGPKENGHRPAVDPMFRSAARAYGPALVSVVLSGNFDCGTAGSMSVKARGGVTIVQDPADASAPDMPTSAIAHAPIDHVVPLLAIPALLDRLVREPAGPMPVAVSHDILQLEGEELGAPAPIVCPACHGRMTESEVSGHVALRCHVGHAYSLVRLSAEQAEETERALWEAMRSLEESATFAARIATMSSGELRSRFEEKARTQKEQASRVRSLLLDADLLHASDAPRPSDLIDPKKP